MIDYILSFTSEAAAKADPTVGPLFVASTDVITGNTIDKWASNVIPGSQSWNPAGDVVVGNVVTHTLSTGWWCVVAQPTRVAAFDNHTNLVVCLDRDAAAGGALPATYILKFANTFPNIISLLNTLRFQPVYLGSHYAALGVT